MERGRGPLDGLDRRRQLLVDCADQIFIDSSNVRTMGPVARAQSAAVEPEGFRLRDARHFGCCCGYGGVCSNLSATNAQRMIGMRSKL
mmetsp:Transcript_7959/g.19820  ORF Transcript_7959/g.19820 Transcript_7959/m.19820 type:complete len:88 (+) Transcript_7959:2298-2561(+)